VIHGIQLLTDGSNKDILIAGRTRATTTSANDFYVTQLNWSGRMFDWTPIVIDFGTGRDDVAWDVVKRETVIPFNIVVGGYSCASICDLAADPTPDSNFALAGLKEDPNNPGKWIIDNSFGLLGDARRQYDLAHTDIGYSMTLQEPFTNDVRFVIGGYSSADSGTPYMSGARFPFNGTDTPAVRNFRSNFGGIGSNGDRAWELKNQSDQMIVVGGVYTKPGSGPAFGAMRLCKDPEASGTNCSIVLGPGGGGGGGKAGFHASFEPLFPSASLGTPHGSGEVGRTPAASAARHDRPALPLPEVIGDLQTPGSDATPLTIVAAETAMDYLFTPPLALIHGDDDSLTFASVLLEPL
jgi:hypothetical protein